MGRRPMRFFLYWYMFRQAAAWRWGWLACCCLVPLRCWWGLRGICWRPASGTGGSFWPLCPFSFFSTSSNVFLQPPKSLSWDFWWRLRQGWPIWFWTPFLWQCFPGGWRARRRPRRWASLWEGWFRWSISAGRIPAYCVWWNAGSTEALWSRPAPTAPRSLWAAYPCP